MLKVSLSDKWFVFGLMEPRKELMEEVFQDQVEFYGTKEQLVTDSTRIRAHKKLMDILNDRNNNNRSAA